MLGRRRGDVNRLACGKWSSWWFAWASPTPMNVPAGNSTSRYSDVVVSEAPGAADRTGVAHRLLDRAEQVGPLGEERPLVGVCANNQGP